MLAGAFRSDDATTPLRGVPAHRAPDELSLGRIFRSESDSSPSSGQVADRPGDFPLDQFFAADAAHEQPSGGADDGSDTPPSSDDVEQFNAWLDGLKKT